MDDATIPDCSVLIDKSKQKFYSKESRTLAHDKVLDEKFEKIDSSLDINEVKELMGQVYRYVYENYIVIPIAEINEEIGVSKNIS